MIKLDFWSATQCGDLDCQIAILDREARPCRLNERILRHRRTGTLNKYVKQRHGTFTQRDAFGVPKKGLALHIEAKRTECINCRDRPALPFGKIFKTLRAALTT
jgi:hypothetical protein